MIIDEIILRFKGKNVAVIGGIMDIKPGDVLELHAKDIEAARLDFLEDDKENTQ